MFLVFDKEHIKRRRFWLGMVEEGGGWSNEQDGWKVIGLV